jgi:hypothetical protein
MNAAADDIDHPALAIGRIAEVLNFADVRLDVKDRAAR